MALTMQNGPYNHIPDKVVGPTRALPNRFMVANATRLVSVAHRIPRGERGNAAKIPKAIPAATTRAAKLEIHSSPVIMR